MKKNDDFIMLPTVDFCFAGLMENPKVRRGFIAALMNVLPEEIKDTILLPTFLQRESADDKMGILDVRVLMKTEMQFDIEMQVAYFAYWDQRVLFYLSKMYTSQLKKGESYEKLKKCIHVSILNFLHFPGDEECYRKIHLRNDLSGELYTDLFEIQILELKKLPKEVEDSRNVIKWMQFFSGNSREEFEGMAKTDEYLDEAYQTLAMMSADEKKRMEYEARERALKDYNTQISSAEKRGEERTREVFRLYMQGKSSEEIAQECRITIEKVEEILF